jgi:ABC-type glycerol-3-phosphate transport system substrate-binding protein
VRYVIPKEGAINYFDMLAIPADAPHPENALAFLNYLMDPQVIAKVTNKVRFANGNLASLRTSKTRSRMTRASTRMPPRAPAVPGSRRVAAVQPRAEPILDPRPQRSVTRQVSRILAFAAIAALAACGGKAEEKDG